jgi:triosephosphate isomerase
MAESTETSAGRVPLIAGNWKMNLDHQQATVLVQKLDWTLKDKRHDHAETEVAVIPPYTDLRSVQTLIDGDKLKLKLGAQDLSPHDAGAYTGDISGEFLAKLGCEYVPAHRRPADGRPGRRGGQGRRDDGRRLRTDLGHRHR